MCKCTAGIVWEWEGEWERETTMNVGLVWELREKQCFVAECVWELREEQCFDELSLCMRVESWEWEEQCLQCSNELSLCMRVESERDLDLDKTRWDPDMTSQRGAIIDHI